MKIGFIGLGNMGEPFAEHLVNAGHELHFADIREAIVQRWERRGAKSWPNARDLCDHVETVLLSLPTPSVVEQVALGEQGIHLGSAVRRVVDLSTTGPLVTRFIAARLADRNITMADAPVSGGVAGARAATVTIMLSCGDADLELLRPILSVLGRIFHVGREPGLGQTAKILNNLLSAGALLLAGEATAMGVKAGLDPAVLIDIFNAGSGRSSATLDKYPKAILPGTFSLGFTNGLMLKDVNLCLQLADEMGLAMPTARSVRDQWLVAMRESGPDADFTTIVHKSERDAGVEVRAPRKA